MVLPDGLERLMGGGAQRSLGMSRVVKGGRTGT